MEPSWDIGDGYLRWCRGISETRFNQSKLLMTLVRPDLLAYVSGCHVKYVQLGLPTSEVIRMFHPGLEGIELLEGNPRRGVFALAEMARHPRIFVYKFQGTKDYLISELKGGAENRYRAIRFDDGELLHTMSGVPELCISVWNWTTGEQMMVVNCLEKGYESDLLISSVKSDIWLEWSRTYLTFYELISLSNEKTIIRTDVALPSNDSIMDLPDPRFGNPISIDILSVTFDYGGNVFVLDQNNYIYKINPEEKVLVPVGSIDTSVESQGVTIESIVPYGRSIAAILSSGVFLILQVKEKEELKLKSRMDFSSKIRKFIPNPCAPHPATSFYAVTDIEKRLECVVDGKMRAYYSILDLSLSEILSVSFIERDAQYLAAVSEKGHVYILDAETGNVYVKWSLPFYAESIISHPLLPMVAIGTPNGSIIFLNITDLKNPRVIHRSFLCQDTEIDKLSWTCRGRYLLAGDSKRRHLFLTYGLPSLEFHYLDYSSLSGRIRAINTPASWKDKRVQVVLDESETDQVPFQINNYRLDGESLELVASQILDAPIKTLCFSSYKKLMYGYTCENHSVGMSLFTEDMHGGGLLEPEIVFEGDLPLHVNRIVLVGDRLYTFGEDGYAMQHFPPSPKATALNTEEVIQTHFPNFDGIKDGFLSMNGCHLLAIGYDNTIVHLKLKPESGMLSWGLLGYGLDLTRLVNIQMKYFESIIHSAHKEIEIGDDEIDLYMESVNDEKSYQGKRNESLVTGVKEGLTRIRAKIQELIELNFTRDPPEQLRLDEFELDDEVEELEAKECDKDKQIAQIMVTSLIEERDQWAGRMKGLVWDEFQVKISKIHGFNVSREVSNYPLRPSVEDQLKEMEILRQERRIEKKLLVVDGALERGKKEAAAKVIRFAKKRRVRRHRMDLSKYPPHLRDEMRKMLKVMPPESDSEDDGEESGGPEEDILQEISSQYLMESDLNLRLEDGEDEEAENDEGEEEEDEDDEGEDEGDVGMVTEIDEPMENEVVNEIVLDDLVLMKDEGNEDEEEVEEKEEEEEEKEEEEEDEDEELDDDVGGIDASPPASVASVKSIGSESGVDVDLEEERKKPQPMSVVELIDDEPDDEGYEADPLPDDFDVLETETYLTRRVKGRKKRRLVLVRVNDDEDDETRVLMEEDESSDQSESDMERQIEREEERERRLARLLSPEESERRQILSTLYSGSLTYQFFVPDPLLYDQLDLAALKEIHSQIKVVTSEIRKLKLKFNESFEEVKEFKGMEMERINGRNIRIREIAQFFSIHVEVKDSDLTIFEQPETIFKVTEAEVPIPRLLSEEEKEALERAGLVREAEAKKEEKRISQESQQQHQYERPEDLLKMDIPKPHFLVIKKEEWKWSAEEIELAGAYYKRVGELERARAENRKQQESELRALLKSNGDGKAEFDDRLKKLQELKLMIELCIQMEEVKLSRMVRQIMTRFQVEQEQTQLNTLLKRCQYSIKISHGVGADLGSRVDNYTIQYNALTEKEKLLEKTFRMDLGEVGYLYDTFAKLYKKRPKLNLKTDKTGDMLRVMIRVLGSQNMTTTRTHEGGIQESVSDAIYELDDPVQIPPGCPKSTWDRFCRLRHEKMLCEYEAKLIGDELTTLHKVVATFKGREGEGQRSIAALLTQLSRQRDTRLAIIHNVEFQMVVRDGQLELPQALLRQDFYNAILIQKYLVEACNAKIKKYEGLKLVGLEKAKTQHRSVKQIEWKFKKVELEEKHAQEKLKDINTLRITKEVVKFLESYEDFKGEGERRLESARRLENGFQRFHDKAMSQRGSIWRRLKTNLMTTLKDNELKEDLVQERNVRVSDKGMLCNVGNRTDILRSHQERMYVIMRSAFLMRQIGKNAEEIFCLETELDRLYKKTFPLL